MGVDRRSIMGEEVDRLIKPGPQDACLPDMTIRNGGM
jgi:hypothetical protein